MTKRKNIYSAIYAVINSDKLKVLLLIFVLVPLALGQSHFYFLKFLDKDASTYFYIFGFFILCFLPLTSGRLDIDGYKTFLIYYLIAGLLYFNFNFEIEKLKIYFQSILFFLILIQLNISPTNAPKIWKWILIVGSFLIVANSFCLLFWFFDFDNFLIGSVDRYSSIDRPDLNPFFFGVFGLSESYYIEKFGLKFGRLQGWSVEPGHWGYFLFFYLSAIFALLATAPKHRNYLYLLFIPFLVHIFFVHSTTVFLCLLIFLTAVFLMIFMMINIGECKITATYMFIILAMIGIGIPFALNIFLTEEFFYSETVFSEGRNWRGKIDFLSLNLDLYSIFLPLQYKLSASHNFLLDLYLKSGWVVLGAFVLSMCQAIKKVVLPENFYFGCAVMVFLVAHLFLVPTQLFFLSCLGWVFLLFITKNFITHRDYQPDLVK